MSELFLIVAVVDAKPAEVIKWWFSAASTALMNRTGDSWAVAPDDTDPLDHLVARQIGLCTVVGALALKVAHVPPGPQIDAIDTLAHVTGTLIDLKSAFAAPQAEQKADRQLIPPRWPTFPPPIDPESPSPIDAPKDTPTALSIARWLENLCEQWSDLEDLRIARPSLLDLGDPIARPVPLILTSAA